MDRADGSGSGAHRGRLTLLEHVSAVHRPALRGRSRPRLCRRGCLVFAWRTDTFGLVLLEALACGTPIAAFPVIGPKDVLAGAEGMIGAMDQDLRTAALAALQADRAACRAHAERYSWRACAELFLSHLMPLHQVAEGRTVPQNPTRPEVRLR